MGDWYKSWIHDPIDNTLEAMLGQNIGRRLGSREGGFGQEIENWTNPTQQLSERNPMWRMVTGKYKFGDSENKWYDETGNNVAKTLALMYGGYAAGTGAMGGAEGGGSPLGGDVTSSTPWTSPAMKGGGLSNFSKYRSLGGNTGGGGGQGTQEAPRLKYFVRLRDQKQKDLDYRLKHDLPLTE